MGILLVHTAYGFGFGVSYIPSTDTISSYIIGFIYLTMQGICAPAFKFLFGVSFFFILKSKHYSVSKFIWRCMILFAFGVFNRMFFTGDILIWYAIIGMLIPLFRDFSPKQLYLIGSILYCLSVVISYFNIIQEPQADSPLELHIFQYPSLNYIKDIVVHYVFSDTFRTLSLVLFGYACAKDGLITTIPTLLNRYFLILCWVIVASLALLYQKPNFKILSTEIRPIFSTFTYIYTFVFLYYRVHLVQQISKWLQPYGRLGLTNYSLQGIIGVFCFAPNGLGLCYRSPIVAFTWAFSFYAVQCLYSFWWRQHFNYGPFEWLWRVCTERKIIANKK